MLTRPGIEAPRRGCWGHGSQMSCSIASRVSGSGLQGLAGGELQNTYIRMILLQLPRPPSWLAAMMETGMRIRPLPLIYVCSSTISTWS